MKCDKIKKRMHLYSELSEDEKRMIDMHLKNCSSCTAIFNRLKYKDLIIQKLEISEPELTYPDVIVSNIMQSIASIEKVKVKSNPFNALLDIILSYKIKIVAFAIVAGLIGLFAYQQLLIMSKLNQMEERLASKNYENELGTTNTAVTKSKFMKELVLFAEDDQVMLTKETLDHYFEKYKNLQTDHEELLELLKANLSKLEKKLSKKDKEKLKKLLEEKGIENTLTTKL